MKEITNDIWVYIDLRNQKYFDLSMRVLAGGRELAQSLSGRSVAVLTGIGDSGKGQNQDREDISGISIDTALEICISKGADEVLAVEHPDLDIFMPDIQASALSQIIHKRSPRAVLFSLSDFGREIAARCAVMNNSGLIADCVELNVVDENIVAGCPSWGGEIMARLTFTDPSTTGFITVQPHSFQICEVKGDPGKIEKIRLNKIDITKKMIRLSSMPEQADQRKLEEAKTVVVGGAGVVNAGGFGMIRRLAAALGGEVGATRPPVMKHWVDEERLIGQTGKTIRPDLLITVGTSGAVQYTAGIIESNRIVAINRDPNSPIFDMADTGIVADAQSILPVITKRVKKIVMRDLADVLSGEKIPEAGNGFGEKIKKLRESHEWTLEDLAQKTDQSPDFIQQVEKNEVVPSVGFLLKLSNALDVDPGTFLREEEKAAIQDKRAQAFIKRTKNYAYQTLTPGAENQHLRGFMITIEPRQAHKPVAYKHEGEEFVYVMEGSLELTLDNKVHLLKVNESMHYNSEIPHKLKNLGSEITRCLVILYTP